jgi:general L-amino acid transport system permease protein
MSDRRVGLGLGEDVDLTRFEAEAGAAAAELEAPTSPREWVRRNLLSSWINAVTTIVTGAFVLFVVYQTVQFVVVDAEWTIVQVNMNAYMVGRFPTDELWRVWVCAYAVALLAGITFGASGRVIHFTARRLVVGSLVGLFAAVVLLYTIQSSLVRALTAGLAVAPLLGFWAGRAGGRRLRRPLIIAWLLIFPAIIVVVVGFGGVSPRLWEGFFFNMIAATVGIAASFPLGILLALGRRSDLPAVRTVSVIFIEIFRGVPLVAWLIFSKYVVDLLLPPQMEIPDIIKAFLAMTLFSAAYVGEIVRGGLQGVPFGQYEAARALGLSTTRMMALVILPQALRSTIPAMISHFISLFKDTSLFVAIEVIDLLAAARRSANSLEFFGRDMETLLFAGLIFWAVAFAMSRWSQRLELRLGVGER